MMKKILFFTILLVLFSFSPSFVESKLIYVLEVRGVINPIIVGYVERGINVAQNEGAYMLIIKLNTPGGLAESMREIVEDMLNSKLPIVVYVTPPGGRAASAGLFIAVAADFLAMSGGTNIGAAHPVAIGGQMSKEMKDKVTHDAAAYIRSISREKRNIKWIEKAVRESVSITAKEAVEKNVADFIANNIDEVMKKVNNKKVKRLKMEIAIEDYELKHYKMNFIENFLHTIINPNIAYILMLIAIYGIIYELMNPGAILPGVVGVIALILAFLAFGALPINYAGLALIGFAILLAIAEIYTAGIGILTVGAVISFILGSLMLFTSKPPYISVGVSLSVLLPATLITATFFILSLHFVVKALRIKKPVSGVEALIGKVGIVKTELNPTGIVLVSGEDWNAISISDKIEKDEKVEVVEVVGLQLKVKKIEK